MASEYSSIARPYAEAVFSLAEDSNTLDQWSGVLGFLAAVASDSDLLQIITNPSVDNAHLEALLLDIAGDRLDKEATNQYLDSIKQ